MAQAIIEQRISTLQHVLRSARLLQRLDLPSDRTGLGSMVRVRDLDTGDQCELTLVGAPETNPSRDLISVDCPLCAALSGRSEGERVVVRVAAGVATYEILSFRPVELDD